MLVSINNKRRILLLITISIAIAAGIAITSFLNYRKFEYYYRGEVEQELNVIANLKKIELIHYRKERLADANIFYKNILFSSLVLRFFKNNDLKAKNEIFEWLEKVKTQYQYKYITLCDTKFEKKLSIPEKVSVNCPYLANHKSEFHSVKFTDLHRGMDNKTIHFSLIVPVLNKSFNRVIGFLVLWIDPGQYLYPFINRWPTLSKSAETLLVRKNENDVLFLNELRFKKDTALKLRFPLSKTDLPAGMAVSGKEGIVEGLDYRGVPVIAAIKKITGSPWFIVARMDKAEVYEPLKSRLYQTLIIIFAMITGIAALIGLVLKHQSVIFFREKFRIESERGWLYDLISRSLNEIYVFDPYSKKFIFVNNGACNNLGYSAEEMLELTPQHLNPNSSDEKFRARLESLLNKEKEELIFEAEHLRKDGSTYPVEIHLQLLRSEDREVFLSLVNDITRRKEAEEALKKSEEHFRSLVEGAPDAIFIQTDFRFAYVNKAAISLFGAESPDNLIGQPVLDRIAESRREKVRKDISKYDKEGGKPLPKIENVYLKMDGTEVHVEASSVTIEYEGKNGRLVFVRDITERKNAEDLLAAEKERLSVTLRSIGDAVITTDLKGKIIIMNNVAENLTGWQIDDAIGRPLEDIFNIFNEITRNRCESPVKKVLNTGEIIELANHTILVSKDGTERIIADSGAPIKDRNNVVIGVVLVFRDITEKQKIYDHLQRSEKLNSLGVLAGGIAHDFNNLLNSIYGYVELARDTNTQGKEYMTYLDKALQSFGKAKSLTQQLLTFAKGGAPVLRTGEIGPLLKENAEFTLSGSNITCDFEIQDKLWLCDFDKNQMSQVINNILLNAKQAMQDGGKITITAENITNKKIFNNALDIEKFVKISIKDTGTGISQEIREKIFDPFFSTKPEGSGLGLATTYSIIEKHDGIIEVNSTSGDGTTFHIYLPASEKTTIIENPENQETHTGSGSILIMDDEHHILEISGIMLEKMGYNVIKAQNGDEAVKLVNKTLNDKIPVKAIILDLTITGGKGGKEIIPEIRKLVNDIPVFASSGYSDNPVMSNPSEYGFTDSLSKPYKFSELGEILNRYLSDTT